MGKNRPLGDRRRLARQCGFVDAQDITGNQNAVGRKALSLPDQDNVARNQRASRDRSLNAVADHPRVGLRQIPQGGEGLFASRFLQDDEADRGQGAGHQEQALSEVAQHQVECGGADEQQEHRLAHGLEGDAPDPASARRGQLVGADGGEALLGFSLAEAVWCQDIHGSGPASFWRHLKVARSVPQRDRAAEIVEDIFGGAAQQEFASARTAIGAYHRRPGRRFSMCRSRTLSIAARHRQECAATSSVPRWCPAHVTAPTPATARSASR